jgi:triacylglycerol lipase
VQIHETDFVDAFNAAIESCFRVVNFLDVVPYVPPAPYVHVGAQITVDSGGPVQIGLSALIAARK